MSRISPASPVTAYISRLSGTDARFFSVDTGGIEPRSDDPILKQMKTQAEVAVETADVIVFMVDVNVGLTAADRDIATMLKKSGKAGHSGSSTRSTQSASFRWSTMSSTSSALTRTRYLSRACTEPVRGDLLDRVLEICPADEEKEDDSDIIKVAVIGKPNAGKSSIINKILGEDRLIVSNVPGTTRDAVDTRLDNEYGKFVFIDTAGIRRQSKVEDRIEKFSVLRAKMAVERADVCIIMIDANEGVTEQDEKIAGIAHEAGKASIICINKWDTVETEDKNTVEYDKKVYTALSYMMYAPTLYVSAKTGQRVTKLFEMITYVHNQNCMRVTTGMLNDDAQRRR